MDNAKTVSSNVEPSENEDDTTSSTGSILKTSEGVPVSNKTSESSALEWDLNTPDESFKLSMRLKEISGLTYDKYNQQLLAINDEKGRIYRINPGTGKIFANEKFAKNGDYEGIQMVGKDIYVLKSNGHVYRQDRAKEDGNDLIRTELRALNDAEGLTYDPTTNQLLLACKGKSKISSDQQIKKSKVIYGLDLESEITAKDPVFIISDDDLEAHVRGMESLKNSDQKTIKSLVKRAKSFAPSGIAYRSDRDQFYILSSVGKLMVILNRGGDINSIHFLDKEIHAQPEGICFDDQGNLYISNEGKWGIARIHRFNS